MTESAETISLLQHLAGRPGHDEVKAAFAQLLVSEFGVQRNDLDFEARVPEVRGRIDALIGRTVFEAKSDLKREWADVERRMPDYLADRERETGEQFVGLASDGLTWSVFELHAGSLNVVKTTVLAPEHAGRFLAWLDGALALKASLPPDALTIRAELGQDSVAYHLVDTRLRHLWDRLRDDPAVALKRQLWEQMLKLVYGREVESDALWFQHTFLVIVAKCIALAVMRLVEDAPTKLLSGETFTAAGINGAVESDFFDWVVADPEGDALVRRIMAHVRRFRLSEVESDVLKILYESLIDRDERHGLGEYYTPDWLAAKVVKAAVDRPLEQKVLDPACGSGTFLFHALRLFLEEAEDAGLEPGRRAAEATAFVCGFDIHPVAVIIARVTYLLALAPALDTRAGSVSIPVFLGDALQLSIREFMTGKELTIQVPPPPAGSAAAGPGRDVLSFPDTFCRDSALFDKALERMRTGSLTGLTRRQIETALLRIVEQHYRADVTREQQLAVGDLGKTYEVFDRLRREGRDTVWAYVARNLSRPLAFSAAGGWANVLVGNPPWVAFRHMSTDLQTRFKELAKGERVYVGGKLATQNDLCALFTVRAAHLYLRSSGRIAFVLPLAALTRGQFEKLRTGSFDSVRLRWEDVWTMDDRLAPLFPVPACVVIGRRRATASALPETVTAYTGSLPMRDAPEALADQRLTVAHRAPALEVARYSSGSVYRSQFRQGATLVPRSLCLVEEQTSGRLGRDLSAPLVQGRKSGLDRKPWADLSPLRKRVESEFVRPVMLGESILPYRVFKVFLGVIPVDTDGRMLDAEAAANRGFTALADWMRDAEQLWCENRPGKDMTLTERWDFNAELTSQFPIPKYRVLYAKAGTYPAACSLFGSFETIDHMLYWCSVDNKDEAQYLVSILNSDNLRSRAERYQVRGQFGARHFDKVMFNLPIPRFDPEIALHQDLAAAAEEAERMAAAVDLPEGVKFQRARRLVRDALTEAGIGPRIDALVARLLDGRG